MSVLFSTPKPPKVNVPPPEKLEPLQPPPPPPPPLPPPAPMGDTVQEASAETRRKLRGRGKSQTILTSPVGVVNAPASKTLLSQ
jgi:hypothetical protein